MTRNEAELVAIYLDEHPEWYEHKEEKELRGV